MRATVLRTVVLSAALALPLVVGGARAQEATPEAGGLPPGVALVPIDEVAPLDLPVEPSALAVYRLEMEPNAAIPTHPHPGLEFAIVEAGAYSSLSDSGPAQRVIHVAGGPAVEAGPGQELTAETGDTVIIPAGNYSDTRAGDEGATLLILEVVPEQNTFEP